MAENSLSTKNLGNYPEDFSLVGRDYKKVSDLRYGTNPSQTAALYNSNSFLGSLRELRTGKQGLSQTNVEDIFWAALITGYFDKPSAIIMKHENPCGFATQHESESLCEIYEKAADSDFRAAFGGVVLINRQIDLKTAGSIKKTFTEVVVAPDYGDGVVEKLSRGTTRILKYDEKRFAAIPRFIGDKNEPEIKKLPDGSVIISDTLLTPIFSEQNLEKYAVSKRKPTENEFRDLLIGYRIRLRSNSVRMIKNGHTVALGTGQQDRIGCIEIAAFRNKRLEELAEEAGRQRVANYSIENSVLVSDGFFPFTDSIELAKKLGVTAVLASHGGKNFEQILEKANELKIGFIDLPGEMRFFDHH